MIEVSISIAHSRLVRYDAVIRVPPQLVILLFLFSLTETQGTNLHLLSILWDHIAGMVLSQTAIQAVIIRALFFCVISELEFTYVHFFFPK